MPRQGRAAFLDRDGVINRDTGYVGKVAAFELLAGVPKALRRLAHHGYALVVVTNQSGIGRGYYSESDHTAVTQHMKAVLAAEHVDLAGIFHCPHAPGAGCVCRKPSPALILQGLAQVGACAQRSILFGDKRSDIAAGRNAGLGRCYLVGEPRAAAAMGADGGAPSLLACVERFVHN